MVSAHWFVTLLPFGLLSIILVLVWVYHLSVKRKAIEFFKNICAQKDITAAHISGNGREMTCSYLGKNYALSYFPGAKNSPPTLTLSTNAAIAAAMSVRKEGKTERLAKNIGLTNELQTQDSLFDDEFFLDTDDLQFFQSYLRCENKRRAIQHIFSSAWPVQKIDFGKGKINIVLEPFKIHDQGSFKPQTLFDQLLVLGEDLPKKALPSASQNSYHRTSRRNHLILLAVSIALVFATGLTLLIKGQDEFPPLRHGFLLKGFYYSLPAVVVYLWLIFDLLRGRSTSHTNFSLAAIFGTGAIILCAIGAIAFTNGYLDRSDSETHIVQIAGKFCKKSKNHCNYFLSFDSWRYPGEIEELRINSHLFQSIQPGDSYQLDIRKGYWGQEWVSQQSLIKEKQTDR